MLKFCFLEMITRLIGAMRNPGLMDGTVTLQEVFSNVMCQLPNEKRISQMWSTTPFKLDFPSCTNIYIPHRFYLKDRTVVKFFDGFVDYLKECKNNLVLITAPPGMGNLVLQWSYALSSLLRCISIL